MKLDQYLREKGVTHAEFAARIGCEQPSVTRFAKGRRVPSPELMRRIAIETCGAVTANDFYAIENTIARSPDRKGGTVRCNAGDAA